MHLKHAATAKLLQALSVSDGKLHRDAGQVRWCVELTPAESSASVTAEFLKILANDVRMLEVNDALTDIDDFQSLKGGDSVRFEVRFNVNDNFFLTLPDAQDYYVTASHKFLNFLVFDGCVLACEHVQPSAWRSFTERHDLLVSFFDNLEKLAHHKGDREAIFVDPSEKYFPSLAMSTDVAKIYFKDKAIFASANIPQLVFLLAESNEQNNSHHLKEISVFRTSLFELLKPIRESEDPTDTTILLLENIAELEKIYSNNLQAYISGLSLEKLKSELATEQMKMSDQATSGLMDISGKMFALPAAIGLSRMPVFSDSQNVSNIIVFVTCIILIMPLLSQKKQLKIIKHSNSIAFKSLDEKIHRERGKVVADELKDIRTNLKNTIDSVATTINIFIVLAILPLLYVGHSIGVFDLFFETISSQITRYAAT